MKISLTSLLIAITFILNTTLASAEAISDDDELKSTIYMYAHNMGLASGMASNCSDEDALSRIKVLRRRGLERFSEAGFPLKSVEHFDDYIQQNIKNESSNIGTRCDEDSLKTFMRAIELDYKLLDDVLSRYLVPQ